MGQMKTFVWSIEIRHVGAAAMGLPLGLVSAWVGTSLARAFVCLPIIQGIQKNVLSALGRYLHKKLTTG